MEWLADGQKVAEVRNSSLWRGHEVGKTVCSGTTIGHKKIDLFDRTNSQRIAVNILSLPARRIREFQLFNGTRGTK